FRVLKESDTSRGIDLCVYTRGGDVNAVWPVVSILREFDADFEVLVPFRCHSAGTLVALGAKTIVMGPLSELSPIDPSTGNQFNPPDPRNSDSKLAISVEDVRAYRTFIADQLSDSVDTEERAPDVPIERIAPFIDRLATQVHPLALGNVQRVLLQVR